MGQQYYGIIGNGETCALISPLGSIDWFCLPRFDGDLVFAKALDPINGEALTLSYLEQKRELAFSKVSQQYLPRTNILETTMEFRGLQVKVIDFMPWTYRGGERAIVRKLTFRNTNSRTRSIELAVKTRKPAGKDPDHRELMDGDILTKSERYALGAVMPAAKVRLKSGEERSLSLVLCYESDEKRLRAVMEGWRERDLDEVLRSTKDFWSNWLDRGRPIELDGTDAQVIERSLLCMKLLQYNSGAFIAAPTASFPAYPGLNDNWDYRFCWIRDTYFASRALLLAGHFDEVQASLRFLLPLQGKDGHWKQPFYTITGELPPTEIVIENLRGPHKEINIRINNGARDQLQIDSEGSILHLLYLYLVFSKEEQFVRQHWNAIVRSADWLAKSWHLPENGIWEFRERPMQWTYGKVLCYVGLESACKIADILKLPKKIAWIAAKDRIRKQVIAESWSAQRGAFLQTYEEDSPIDISALSLAEYGLVAPDSAKMTQTVKRIEGKLLFEGGVRRYESAVLPFFMPTLWLAGHYVRTREMRKARQLLDHAIANTTALHLAAEHYDPRTGTQHGNYPQLFCMSMFVEQLILYHHKPGVIENLNLLNLPLKKTAEVVEELLINPLRKMFS